MFHTLRSYLILCKPRVVLLMLLTAWAGMYLAATQEIPWQLWVNATLGIAFMSSSAAALNHIIEHRIDAIMARTKNRPLPKQAISLWSAWLFAAILGISGFIILYAGVNTTTAILTLCTAIGYSIIYSVFLKRITSQNIVIGGLSGAMPPLLGWTAVTGHMAAQGWLLVLIIFAWTPAHFWALCLNRFSDYQKAPFPMLPVTHGIRFTKLNILFYSILTAVCSVLPYVIGMSGNLYLICALLLDVGLIGYAVKLYRATDDQQISLRTFHYSLIYLTGLFLVILLDHYLLVS